MLLFILAVRAAAATTTMICVTTVGDGEMSAVWRPEPLSTAPELTHFPLLSAEMNVSRKISSSLALTVCLYVCVWASVCWWKFKLI